MVYSAPPPPVSVTLNWHRFPFQCVSLCSCYGFGCIVLCFMSENSENVSKMGDRLGLPFSPCGFLQRSAVGSSQNQGITGELSSSFPDMDPKASLTASCTGKVLLWQMNAPDITLISEWRAERELLMKCISGCVLFHGVGRGACCISIQLVQMRIIQALFFSCWLNTAVCLKLSTGRWSYSLC